MPLIFAVFPVLIIEALVFWAAASWLGIGWALFLMFALMAVGLLAAPLEMRRVGALAARQKVTPGRVAGDYGLLTAGAILAGSPGIASSVVGLLLILPPTRAVVRGLLARKLMKSIEDLGVRSFEATQAGRQGTSYGSFTDPAAPPADRPGPTGPAEVIDEAEIEKWTKDIRPEDFK
ncbi:MAG: FxsA family protein [Corynebacterium humireducens]|uniref:FxsA family protein n=1 Tax=Corynebacterium humireducens TaxID=1223514 RepID=A0A7X6PMK5_9CORY|nr:FxsA family protein [Corynebacterium humireducens]